MNDWLTQGEHFFQKGQLAAAEKCFQDILAHDPEHLEALNNLAVIAYSRGSLKQALEYLDRALAIEPAFALALENQLNIYARQKNWAQARPVADKLLALCPERLEVLEQAAAVYENTRQHSLARKTLQQALALQPDNQEIAAKLNRLAATPLVWPKISPDESTFSLAEQYRQLQNADDGPRLAARLGNLADPGALNAQDMPSLITRPSSPSLLRGPKAAARVQGASVMFAPLIIAGNAPRLARWLKRQGARAEVADYAPNYLSYQADYTPPANCTIGQMAWFAEQMLEKAKEFDIICLEFACSFKYLPFTSLDINSNKSADPNQPYSDLAALKEAGKKLFFCFWGSESFAQSYVHSHYLKALGFDDIPEPPKQTLRQYKHMRAIAQLADAFLAPSEFEEVVPRFVPFWDICLEIENWPLKSAYRRQVSKILTAPTNFAKKNYDIIQACLNSIFTRHPDIESIFVQNQPNHLVPGLYAQADIGIDQFTYGFGLFGIEMMALGLPVISTYNLGPFAGRMREEAPILQVNNIRELYARIEECIANPDMLPRLGRAGRGYVEEFHRAEVMGQALSHYMEQALGGGAVWQIESRLFAKASAIWKQDPEKVYAFKYFDISVPLFCALKCYEQALLACKEAAEDQYRVSKFTAWRAAIIDMADPKKKTAESYRNHLKATGNEQQIPLLNYFQSIVCDSQALLREAADMMKEAGQLKA